MWRISWSTAWPFCHAPPDWISIAVLWIRPMDREDYSRPGDWSPRATPWRW